MKPVRFLFFLYYYPPVLGTAPKRNSRISTAIAQKTDFSMVCTATRNPQSPPGSNIQLDYIPALDYRRWLRNRRKDGALPEAGKQSRIVQMVIRLINTFPFSILAGEGGLFYFFRLLRFGQSTIRKEKITHLYSSFRPFADHYAAYWLKKRNPNLIWIADFRDLIIDPHYQHIYFPELHHRYFKKVFNRADVLTTVSDGLATHLKAYNEHVITLRNGIEGEIRIPEPVVSPYFTIVYTGSMFLDKRNARPLFESIQSLINEGELKSSDLRIVYAGKDSVYWRQMAAAHDLSFMLEDKGIVSTDEAIIFQQQACINLLLTISSEWLRGVLTGKMIEYFQSGSPVLAIVHGQQDPELQRIVQELHIGDTFSDQPSDIDDIKAFILHEYRLWKDTGMNRKPVDVDVLRNTYAMEVVMRELEERVFFGLRS